MKRRTRIEPPPGGWPWEKPGFTFWRPELNFPPGYVPHLARDTLLTLTEQRKARGAQLETEKRKY